MFEPRIYVSTYAKYNSGNLGGAWLVLFDYADMDEFMADCRKLHADEADPEFMYQDKEGVPSGLVQEGHVSEELFDWLDAVENTGFGIEVFLAADYLGIPWQEVEHAYYGTYDTPEEFAQELAEGTCDEPGQHWPFYHIDWTAAAEDRLMDDYQEEDGHYFHMGY